AAPFFSFRIMVGLGILMLVLAIVGLVLWKRKRLYDRRWYLRAWMLMMPAGFIALLTGWYTAEIGRQPWVVYGVMRTADAASPVAASSVLTSLIVYFVAYMILFGFGSWYLLKVLRHGPDTAPPRVGIDLGKSASRPWSAVDEDEVRLHGPFRKFAGGVVLPHRLRHHDVRAVGRLRARHRHHLAVCRRRGAAGTDDEHRRPHLGRQRNLAGDGRRRPDGGVSRRLCGHPVEPVPADPGHADRADLSRRGLRVPLSR